MTPDLITTLQQLPRLLPLAAMLSLAGLSLGLVWVFFSSLTSTRGHYAHSGIWRMR